MAQHPLTISFDLDNTLWDVDSIIVRAEAAMRDWLAEHTPDAHRAYQPDLIGRLRENVVRQFPQATTDLSFMRTQLLFELMRECGYAEAQARSNAEQAFEVFFEGRNTIEFYPGAMEAVSTLSKSYRLLALTNGNADIERAGLGKLFSGAVNSAEAGAKKPDPKIYQHFLDKYDLHRDHVIHVGDNLVDDIQGASDAGIRSIWVNLTGVTRDPHHAEPHAEVKDLSDLVDVIQQIAD